MTELPARAAAETLYRRAGLGPEDIDVAQFYDCYTITILLQLEDFGFCKKGEGGPFVESGRDRRGRRPAAQYDGGNLSYGYIHGINHVIEGARQLSRHVDFAGSRRGNLFGHVNPVLARERHDPAGGEMTKDGRIVPMTEDVDTSAYFEAASRGDLAVQVCDNFVARLSICPVSTVSIVGVEHELAGHQRLRSGLLVDRRDPPLPGPPGLPRALHSGVSRVGGLSRSASG